MYSKDKYLSNMCPLINPYIALNLIIIILFEQRGLSMYVYFELHYEN